MTATTLCRLGLVALACAPLLAACYPVFGTKRYGRSTPTPRRRLAAWGVPSAPLPLQRYYPSEAVVGYPYAQELLDDYYYYPQDYPSYYYSPAAAYYRQHPGYAYYGYDETSDPVDDLQEEIQEEEREERGESLPIGQETWFETARPRDGYADVNAAFLQNLMLSQAYDEEAAAAAASGRRAGAYDDGEGSEGDWTYGDLREGAYDGFYPVGELEDEEVRELKSLAKKWRKRAGQKTRRPAPGSTPAPTTTTTGAPTAGPRVEARRGQAEVPLLRPAAPLRRPAVEARARTRSVYDTIKQLLSLEQDLGKGPETSRPHKRFVTPDEALVKELSGLKKLTV